LEKNFINNLYEERVHMILEPKNTWILGSGAVDVHMSFNHSEVLLKFKNCEGYSTVVNKIDFIRQSNWIPQDNKRLFSFYSPLQKAFSEN